MIKHLFKMVWNRKRTNFLITVEIFFSFLVLFAVILFGVYYTDNYRRPLGFSYENVWAVGVEAKDSESEDKLLPGSDIIAKQLYLALKEFNEIEAVSAAGSEAMPYSFSSANSGTSVNNRDIMYAWGTASDGLKDVLGLNIVRGRWFGKEDDGMEWRPVVINQLMAEALFDSEDPIGKNVAPEEQIKQWRVVGVVSEFRKGGEFATPENFLFQRFDFDNAKNRVLENFLIKVRPGVTADFEEKIISKLQPLAKDWSFDIDPLSKLRETSQSLSLAPIIAAGLIAGFLMIMVALGLTGVLWQNVTQRTKEIGLRRAKGATVGKIYNQILGELLVIASFGLIVGTAVVVQFPLLDLIGFISGQVFLYSLIISLLFIYLLTFLCGLYPSWLATRIHPAEALHYE